MPRRPSVRCKHQGCIHLITPPDRYCVDHQRQVWRQQKIKHSNNPFYKSKDWILTRSAFIARHPACKQCGQQGAVVDHITAMSLGGAPYEWDNLQTLCRACDQVKRGREQQAHLRLVGKSSKFD